MTKPKPKPQRAVDAVQAAISRETSRRQDGLKPIEIVKVAISAYQAYTYTPELDSEQVVESSDRVGLRRGTQASVDRVLFNANYWLSAYEERIVAACVGADDAKALLKAISVWNTHTLKLNSLSTSEAVVIFERFCPPFAVNNRRGSSGGRTAGKGPLAEFAAKARQVAEENPSCANELTGIVSDMREESAAYDALPANSPLDALFVILPAWCLQDRISLVRGSWWDDADVMKLVADALRKRFEQLGYGDAPCQYFHDSFLEAMDAYQREISSTASPFADMPLPKLIGLVEAARKEHPGFEMDGYGCCLPPWLLAKEQLIWNTLVCALYGPGSARPLLVDSPDMAVAPVRKGGERRSDVITDLARMSYRRYAADRADVDEGHVYDSYADQPPDLKNSGIEHIMSIPKMLEILGYEIVPEGTCYPEQRVTSLTPSEVECLAILEHRRWMSERIQAGWQVSDKRDVEARTSPYLVPWEELPARAQEWNRSAARNIPALLASEHLAIARK